MKATIQSTDRLVNITASSGPPLREPRSVEARVWEGVTEAGVRFTAYIPLVQVATDADNSVFERELTEHKRPDPETLRAIDLRFVL